MDLYKYDKALELEYKILKAARNNNMIRAKFLIFRYNSLVEKLRRISKTDIPLYKIKNVIPITDDAGYVAYEIECGFCGHDASKLKQAKYKVGNRDVRIIRTCDDDMCEFHASRYIRFKLGLLKPSKAGLFQRFSFNFSNMFR